MEFFFIFEPQIECGRKETSNILKSWMFDAFEIFNFIDFIKPRKLVNITNHLVFTVSVAR